MAPFSRDLSLPLLRGENAARGDSRGATPARTHEDPDALVATTRRFRTLDANEAVARIAYQLSEVIAIYPITPSSAMGEHSDAWAADQRPNLWGAVPSVVEMQSEAGAAGAMHGALQAGGLVTTFTASQGLLLMLPDMFKIAGELTAFCMHVAARTIATHALSIFGDHSDVMAARGTGFALLASGSAQEAQDLAAIGHAATLRSRIPFLHFFDGFRTSHEITKVELLDDAVLASLVDDVALREHRARALDPDRPVIRGTSQNPDAYFQSREAAQPFYDRCPSIVDATMARFAELTGRRYRLFDYVGHPRAERVIVMMGSGAECAHETVDHLVASGERVGVLVVRLYRPFSIEHFVGALPTSARSIAVLDRTKEPGSVGEPLLLDITAALVDAVTRGARASLPRVIGGRYGLSSKEFTPAMVKAVFDELAREAPKSRFTVGIRDDVSGSSLDWDPDFDIEPADVSRAVFYGLGSDGTVSANKASIKIIGEHTPGYAQGHFELDSRKSGSTTVSHLRFGPRPIRSTYRISRAQFVAIHDPELVDRRDVLAIAAPGATVLLNTSTPADRVWATLPREVQTELISKRCRLFVIDGNGVAERAGLGRRINIVMQVCFFALAKVLPLDAALREIRKSLEATYGRRGPEVVRRNVAALEGALEALHEVSLPAAPSATRHRQPGVAPRARTSTPDFVQRVTRLLIEGHGDQLPVSAFPPDGTWPTGTSKFEKRAIAVEIPIWQPDLCAQCNFCSMICPHAAIQTKVFAPSELAGAPAGFRSVPETFEPALAGLQFAVQVAPEDCTGCGLCIEVCPAKDRRQPRRKALMAEPLAEHRDTERAAFAFFEQIEPAPLGALPIDKRTAAFRLPLFEFSGACTGCGETPYVRLLTQLYGDRLLIANATGCSSIYGGNLPTTPYTTDRHGRGPAWANSLFEDNAEFGLGMRLALDVHARRARELLAALAGRLPAALVDGLVSPPGDDEWIAAQRTRILELGQLLAADGTPAAKALLDLAHHLVPRSVWIVGGDGWAYDIGYGGLDHVLASGHDVNILVLDTEVYSNTGGQQSKATPLGAAAKFATAGKATRKKDLGLLAMSYGHVYVAEVAMQARSAQTVQAFQEAAQHRGPSLIIAHSPCIAHGYDLVHSPTQQKRAIDSGMWPLYRFDPQRVARGEAGLVLDSRRPHLDVAKYVEQEARFRMVELRDPERYAALLEGARTAVRQRWELYEQLAKLHVSTEDGHG